MKNREQIKIGKATISPYFHIPNPSGWLSFEAYSILQNYVARVEKLEEVARAAQNAKNNGTQFHGVISYQHPDIWELEVALAKLRGESND